MLLKLVHGTALFLFSLPRTVVPNSADSLGILGSEDVAVVVAPCQNEEEEKSSLIVLFGGIE